MLAADDLLQDWGFWLCRPRAWTEDMSFRMMQNDNAISEQVVLDQDHKNRILFVTLAVEA